MTKRRRKGMITYEDVRSNEEIRTYITAGNNALGIIGLTEHGFVHAGRTANTAAKILKSIGCGEREIELARIAGFMHDCGNMINRHYHAMHGALVAFSSLQKLGMEPQELSQVVSAIGNHEGTGQAVSRVSAAIIIADKSDVRRSRVRDYNEQHLEHDIHDRVNYAVRRSNIEIEGDQIMLTLDIDTSVCPVMDYFEIFLTRMLMCRRAADYLGLHFALSINKTRLL
ncbi:MAG: HD domain-containing protein [Clostridiales bacterium]|nr:HD domain-containing protein [Clostridiales bacterium]